MTQDRDEMELGVMLVEMRGCNGTTVAGAATSMHDRRCPVHGEPSESFATKAEREGYQRGLEAGQRWAIDFVAKMLADAQAEPRHRDRAMTERAGRICALGNLLSDLRAAAEQTPTQPEEDSHGGHQAENA